MASANNHNTVASATSVLRSGEGFNQPVTPGQNSLIGLGLEHQDQAAKTAAWILMSFQSNPNHSMSHSPTPPNLNSQGNAYTHIPNQSEAQSKQFSTFRPNMTQQGLEPGRGAHLRDYNPNGALVTLAQAMSQYMTPAGSELLTQGQRDVSGNFRTAANQNSFASHNPYHMGTQLHQDKHFPNNGFGNLIATQNQASDIGINKIYNSYEMQLRDFNPAASQSFLSHQQAANRMTDPMDMRQEAVDLRTGNSTDSFQKNCDQQREQEKYDEHKCVSISHQNSVSKRQERETNLQSSASTADKALTNKASYEDNNSDTSDQATNFRTVQQQPFNFLGQKSGYGASQQSAQSSTQSADNSTTNNALNEDLTSMTSDQTMSFSMAQQPYNFFRQMPNYGIYQPSHFLSTTGHFPYASQNSFLPYVFNANGMGAAGMSQGNPYYLPMSMFPTAEAYYSAAAANLAQVQFPSMTGHSNPAQFTPSFTPNGGPNRPTNPAAKPPRNRKKATSTTAAAAKVQNLNSNLQSQNPAMSQLLNPHSHLAGPYFNPGALNMATLSQVPPSNPIGHEQNSNSDPKLKARQNKQMKRKPKENKLEDDAMHPNPGKKLKSGDMDWYQQHMLNGKHPEEFENKMKSLKQAIIRSALQTKHAGRCSSGISPPQNNIRGASTMSTEQNKTGGVGDRTISEQKASSPANMQEYKDPSLTSLSQMVNAVSAHTETMSSQSNSRQSYQSSFCNIDPTSTRDFLEEDTSESEKLTLESGFKPFGSLPLNQNNSLGDKKIPHPDISVHDRPEKEIPESETLTETQQKCGTLTDTRPPSLRNNYSQDWPINPTARNSQWTIESSGSVLNQLDSAESHFSGSAVQSVDGGNNDGNIHPQNADWDLSTPVTSRSNCDSVPSMSCLHVDTGLNKSDDDRHSAMFNSPEEVQVYPTSHNAAAKNQNEASPANDCLVKESDREAADTIPSHYEQKRMMYENMTGGHNGDRTDQIYKSTDCNDSNSPQANTVLEESAAETDRKANGITEKTDNCFQEFQPHMSGSFINSSLSVPGSETRQDSHRPTDHNKSYEPVSFGNISSAGTSSVDYLTWPQYGGYTKENKNPHTLSYLPAYLKSPTKQLGAHDVDSVCVSEQVPAFSYMWDRTNVLAPGDDLMKQEGHCESSVVQKCDFIDSRFNGVSPEDALLLRPKCNSEAISNSENFLVGKERSEDVVLWSHDKSHRSGDPESRTNMILENVTQQSLSQSTVSANRDRAELAGSLSLHDPENTLTLPLSAPEPSEPSQHLVSAEIIRREQTHQYLGDSDTCMSLVDGVEFNSLASCKNERTDETPDLASTNTFLCETPDSASTYLGGTPDLASTYLGGIPDLASTCFGGTPDLASTYLCETPDLVNPCLGGSPDLASTYLGGSPDLASTYLPDNQTIKQEVEEDSTNCKSPRNTQINGSEADMKNGSSFEVRCQVVESNQPKSEISKTFFTGIVKKHTHYFPKHHEMTQSSQSKVTKVQTKISCFFKSNYHKKSDSVPQSTIGCNSETPQNQLKAVMATLKVEKYSEVNYGDNIVKVEVTSPRKRLQKRNYSPSQGLDNAKSKKLKLSQPTQSLAALPVFSRGRQMLLKAQTQNLHKHCSLPVKLSSKVTSTFKTPCTSVPYKSSWSKKHRAVTIGTISKNLSKTSKLKNTAKFFDLTKFPAASVMSKINSSCVESSLKLLCPLGALEKLGLFNFPQPRDKYFVIKVEDNNFSCKPLVMQMINNLAPVDSDTSLVYNAMSGMASKSSCKNSMVSSTNGVIKASGVKVALPTVSRMVCDICGRQYSCTTQQHINGDGHKAIVSSPDFYSALDAQILIVGSVDAFIQLVVKVQHKTLTANQNTFPEIIGDLDSGENENKSRVGKLMNPGMPNNQIHSQVKHCQVSLVSGFLFKEICNSKIEVGNSEAEQGLTYHRPLDKQMVLQAPVLNVVNVPYISRKRSFSDVCPELVGVKRQKTSGRMCCKYKAGDSAIPCLQLSEQLDSLEISTQTNLGMAVARIKLPLEVAEPDQDNSDTFEWEVDQLLKIAYPSCSRRTRKLPKLKALKKPKETFVLVKDLCPVSGLCPTNLNHEVSSVNLFHQCLEELQTGAKNDCISAFFQSNDCLKQSIPTWNLLSNKFFPNVGATNN